MEPPLGGGGLRLPGLRQWRLRRGLTQQRLAERAGLDQRQLSKIETGSRGCNPAAARRLAGELGVDVAELRVRPREQETHPAKPRAPRRNLHRAYLGVLLGREVGSAYTVMGEEALERHCKGLSWEGVLEVTRQKARGAGSEGAARRHGPRHLPRPGPPPFGGVSSRTMPSVRAMHVVDPRGWQARLGGPGADEPQVYGPHHRLGAVGDA